MHDVWCTADTSLPSVTQRVWDIPGEPGATYVVLHVAPGGLHELHRLFRQEVGTRGSRLWQHSLLHRGRAAVAHPVSGSRASTRAARCRQCRRWWLDG